MSIDDAGFVHDIAGHWWNVDHTCIINLPELLVRVREYDGKEVTPVGEHVEEVVAHLR